MLSGYGWVSGKRASFARFQNEDDTAQCAHSLNFAGMVWFVDLTAEGSLSFGEAADGALNFAWVEPAVASETSA